MALRKGFGRARRARTWLAVLGNVAAALLVWTAANLLFTQPELRTAFDLSPEARFSLSPATRALIRELRAGERDLEIHTFFVRMNPRDPMAGIQERVVQLVRDLLDRIAWLGGDRVHVVHHDVYREIQASRKARDELGVTRLNTIVLKLGYRRRQLGVLEDLADIELPPEDPAPGRPAVPVLRSFPGEQAIASALRALLDERKLLACWLTGHGEGSPKDVSGAGYERFARQLAVNGFTNRILDLDREGDVPAQCRLLLIMQPDRPLFPRHAQAILAHLRRGGALLFCLGYVPGAPEQPSWRPLLEPLGLALGDGLVANGRLMPGRSVEPLFGVEDCRWLEIRRGIDATHPATETLARSGASVLIPWGRVLSIARERPPEVRIATLLSTNPYAWVEDVPPAGPPDFVPPGKEALGVRRIACAVELAPAPGRRRGGRAIVLGGVAFRNGERLFERNLDLALGFVRWLVERRALVAAPARRVEGTWLDVPPAGRRAAKRLAFAVPAIFLLAAFVLIFWRRRA